MYHHTKVMSSDIDREVSRSAQVKRPRSIQPLVWSAGMARSSTLAVDNATGQGCYMSWGGS